MDYYIEEQTSFKKENGKENKSWAVETLSKS